MCKFRSDKIFYLKFSGLYFWLPFRIQCTQSKLSSRNSICRNDEPYSVSQKWSQNIIKVMNKSKYPKPMLTTFGIWIPRKFSLNENQNPGRSTFISIFFDWKIANKTRFQMQKSIRFTFNTYYNAVPKHLFSMHSIKSKSTTKFNIRQLRFFFHLKILIQKIEERFSFFSQLLGFTGADWFIVRFAIISADWIETLLCHQQPCISIYSTNV